MLNETCFVCCEDLRENSENTDKSSWLKLLLELLGISYCTFTGDLLQNQSDEVVNRECSFCPRCSHLIDAGECLKNSLLVIKKKLADAVATGYQKRQRRRPGKKVRNLEKAAEVVNELAYRLGECFTRPEVVIRPEDEIPIEKLLPQETVPILLVKHEPAEVVYLDEDFGNFSDGFEPEQAFDHSEEESAPPPVKRKRGRPPKIVVDPGLSKHPQSDPLAESSPEVSLSPVPQPQPCKTVRKPRKPSKNLVPDRNLDELENSSISETDDQQPALEGSGATEENHTGNRRSSRKSVKKPIVDFDSSSSSENDTGELSENEFSQQENSSSSEESDYFDPAEYVNVQIKTRKKRKRVQNFKTRKYHCPLCEFRCDHHSGMLRHMSCVHMLKLVSQVSDLNYFVTCLNCSAVFKTDEPLEFPGGLLPEDVTKLKEFSTEHTLCRRPTVSEFTCSKCGDKFDRSSSFFSHCQRCLWGNQPQDSENVQSVPVPDGSSYQCVPCSSGFDSNIEYLHHLRLQHFFENKFKCRCYKCGEHFPNVESLRNHVLENYKLLRCPGCDQSFKSSELYKKHQCKSSHLSEPEETSVTEVPRHFLQLSSGFPCFSCKDQTFENVALLSVHIQEHHHQAQEFTFNCNWCSEKLTSSATLQKVGDESFHSKDNVIYRNFTSLCTQHWKNCSSKPRSAPCSKLTEPSLDCCICHQNQDSPQTLAVHLNQHIEIAELHKCQVCTMIFTTKRFLDRHLAWSHNMKNVENDQYYCRTCHEPFRSTKPEMKLGGVAEQDFVHFHAFLDQHFKCKADRVPPTCKHCNRVFTEVRGLFKHDLNDHSRNCFKYYCDHCGKGFAEVGPLNLHVQFHEMDDGKREKPKCHICNKAFKRQSYLSEHLKSHDKEPPMVCQYCGKGFSIRASFVRHEQNHLVVAPTEPTVPCPICGKLFTTVKYMKYHITYNHQKRPRKPKTSSAKKTQPDD